MSAELDSLAPNYRAAMERWPEAPTLDSHYRAVAESFIGSGHGLIEAVKSYVECVCLTILGEFGKSMPSASPSTSELLVTALRLLGISNTRGASKLDKVLSAYNRLSEALSECRNEVGPVAHGKDGFLDTLYSNQLRTYLLTGDALLALILAALEGTEPDLRHTREPYETFADLHERIDNSVFIRAEFDEAGDTPVFVLTIGAPGLPDGIELRLEPSRMLYSLDRAAFVEILAASTTEVLHDEESEEAERYETPPAAPRATTDTTPAAQFTTTYNGNLAHIQADFCRYLETLSLEPGKSLTDPVANLAPSLLATAEQHMSVDWKDRETLQSRMRIVLRRVLARFGVLPEDAKLSAEHIVSWLRIQTAANVEHASEVGSE